MTFLIIVNASFNSQIFKEIYFYYLSYCTFCWYQWLLFTRYHKKYERIRFRIGPQYPFLCRTRGLKIDQSLGWDRKTRGHLSLQMWPDQDTSCSKAERRPTFCSPLSGMMTSPYGWKIFSELDIKNNKNNQTILQYNKKENIVCLNRDLKFRVKLLNYKPMTR